MPFEGIRINRRAGSSDLSRRRARGSVSWMSTLPPGRSVGVDLLPTTIEDVSVYVHVPFCSSRCNYCDFSFETTRSPRVIQATLDRTIEEAEFFLSSMGRPRVRTLYVGGGTPSVIPPGLLDRFLSKLRSVCFDDPARDTKGIEWTFEANPESMNTELLEVLLHHGVNRLSLGIQSFEDDLLRALTRRADRATARTALRHVDAARRRTGRLRLNIDLLTGIPGQTETMVRSDVKNALDFNVDHFSVYSLTVEERTPLKQALDGKLQRMPSPAGQDSLWFAARDLITASGFDWYEISNFALPGYRSEHNLGYWKLRPYLGLGPGGVSTIPMAAKDAAEPRPVRLTNPNLFVYGSRFDRTWHHEAEPLDARSFLFEHFITGLRTSDGVSLRSLEGIFGVELSSEWENELDGWVVKEVAEAEPLEGSDRRILLTPAARLALDRHLLEIESWIEKLQGLPPPRWP